MGNCQLIKYRHKTKDEGPTATEADYDVNDPTEHIDYKIAVDAFDSDLALAINHPKDTTIREALVHTKTPGVKLLKFMKGHRAERAYMIKFHDLMIVYASSGDHSNICITKEPHDNEKIDDLAILQKYAGNHLLEDTVELTKQYQILCVVAKNSIPVSKLFDLSRYYNGRDETITLYDCDDGIGLEIHKGKPD